MSEIAGRVLMIPKGTYSPTTTYDPLDAVNYEHNSYVCKQTSRGNLPTNTTYWQPLTDVTADEIPTEGSTNLVQSGGVYSALKTINQTLTNYVNNGIYYDGAKNLLPLLISKIKAINTTGSWSKSDENDVYTISGVTYTITSNANGVITNIKASGTGASSSPFSDLYITLRNTYDAFAMYELIKNNTLTVATHAVNSVNFILDGQYNDSWKTVQDISGKADITLNISTSNNVQTCIRIVSGRTVTNEDITPIMAQKSLMDIDDSFSPYAKTNQQLTADTNGLRDNMMKNGAVNYLYNANGSASINQVDFNVDSDNIVTLSGTASSSGARYFILGTGYSYSSAANFKPGIYRFSGTPKTTPDNDVYMEAGCYDSTGNVVGNNRQFVRIRANQTKSFEVPENSKVVVLIWIPASVNASGLVFKPMLSDPSLNLSYDDYVPYAKTNKELTETLQGSLLLRNSVVNHISVIADGTKTIQTLMHELHSALSSLVASLNTDEVIYILGARSDGGTWFRPDNVEIKYTKSSTVGNISMNSFTVTTGDKCYHYSLIFSSTLATNTFRQMIASQSGNTFVNRTSDVPSANSQLLLSYQIYKNV